MRIIVDIIKRQTALRLFGTHGYWMRAVFHPIQSEVAAHDPHHLGDQAGVRGKIFRSDIRHQLSSTSRCWASSRNSWIVAMKR